MSRYTENTARARPQSIIGALSHARSEAKSLGNVKKSGMSFVHNGTYTDVTVLETSGKRRQMRCATFDNVSSTVPTPACTKTNSADVPTIVAIVPIVKGPHSGVFQEDEDEARRCARRSTVASFYQIQTTKGTEQANNHTLANDRAHHQPVSQTNAVVGACQASTTQETAMQQRKAPTRTELMWKKATAMVVPRLSIENYPCFSSHMTGRIRLWEFVIGSDGKVVFDGDHGPGHYKGDTCSFMERVNSVCWGYRPGTTAIRVSFSEESRKSAGEAMPGFPIESLDLAAFCFVTGGFVVGREKKSSIAPLFATSADASDVRGTVTWSASGTMAQFSVTYDRVSRSITPTGSPMVIRTGSTHYEHKADLRIVVHVPEGGEDIITAISDACGEPAHAICFDSSAGFPQDVRSLTTERQRMVCDMTLGAFTKAVSLLRTATTTVWVLTDPAAFHKDTLQVATMRRIELSSTITPSIPPEERPVENENDPVGTLVSLVSLSETYSLPYEAYQWILPLLSAQDVASAVIVTPNNGRMLSRVCNIARLCVYKTECGDLPAIVDPMSLVEELSSDKRTNVVDLVACMRTTLFLRSGC